VDRIPEDLVVEPEVVAEGVVGRVPQQGEDGVDGEIERDQEDGQRKLEASREARKP
jgi:hypothetical protein